MAALLWEAAYPEGTDAPALYQRSYAGKFPFKAGSADRRGCDGHSETGIFSKWHEGNSCRKRERAGSRGIPYGVRAQLYTGRAGALRPAGGFLRKADDFQHTCDCFQSSQGTLRFPCAGCASYPFVDLPPGNELLFFIGFSTFRHHDYFIIGNRFWIIFQNIADFWRICPAQIAMFFGFV